MLNHVLSLFCAKFMLAVIKRFLGVRYDLMTKGIEFSQIKKVVSLLLNPLTYNIALVEAQI